MTLRIVVLYMWITDPRFLHRFMARKVTPLSLRIKQKRPQKSYKGFTLPIPIPHHVFFLLNSLCAVPTIWTPGSGYNYQYIFHPTVSFLHLYHARWGWVLLLNICCIWLTFHQLRNYFAPEREIPRRHFSNARVYIKENTYSWNVWSEKISIFLNMDGEESVGNDDVFYCSGPQERDG